VTVRPLIEENPVSTQPEWFTTSADEVHHIQVKLAFLDDADDARPATLTGVAGHDVSVRYLDGSTATVTVCHPERFAGVVERDDLCRLGGQPLLLVNTTYRVLAVATGPATPPSKLAVQIACRLENGSVAELLSGADDQPAWQTFALTRVRASRSA
jgi:hypothetical protein